VRIEELFPKYFLKKEMNGDIINGRRAEFLKGSCLMYQTMQEIEKEYDVWFIHIYSLTSVFLMEY